MIMKKRYLSPVTNVVETFELDNPVLSGSIVKVKMTVDPLEETYYSVDEEGNESNPDYLIKF